MNEAQRNGSDNYPHAVFAACTILMALLLTVSALWSAAFASPPQAEEIAHRYSLDPTSDWR